MALKDWLARAERRVVSLFVADEPPPPPPPGPKGSPAPRPKPFIVKEPPLSVRRLLIGLEGVILAIAVWNAAGTWRAMLGGWPTRANFFPPVVRAFPGVTAIDVAGGHLWVAGVQGLTLVRLGTRPPEFMDLGGSLPSPVVTAISARPQDTAIGTTRGLVVHDGRRLRRPSGRESVATADVRALARDGSGRLWVGTAQAGLFLREGETYRGFVDELSTPYVTALAPAGLHSVWVGLYAGGVIRTDGQVWERMPAPARQRGKPVRRIAPLPDGSAMVVTDVGVERVSRSGWRSVPTGLSRGDRAVDVAAAQDGGTVLLSRAGVLQLVGGRTDASRLLAPGSRVTAMAAGADAFYYASDNLVYRAAAREPAVPLTDWAEFFEPSSYLSPGADLPGDWQDARFKRLSGRLALVAWLVACALIVRGLRWRRSAEATHWRIGPDRQLAAGCAALGVLYLLQQGGWIATGANRVLMLPILVVAAGWSLLHGLRLLSREYATAQEPFWLGLAFALSGLTAWLWWVHAALIPALWSASAGAMVFGRSLRGLRRGQWSGFPLAWGIGALGVQLAAFSPPLIFAALTWGKAAFTMMPTLPLAQGLPVAPERFSWSEDGQRAAYIVQRNGATLLQIVDATTTAWIPESTPVESAGAVPRFSPDGEVVSVLARKGGDTLVELVGADGRRRWSSRLAGAPSPGLQPCWFRSGTSMLVLTYAGEGTQVWRVGRAKGDAVRLMTVTERLSWPSLSADGLRFAAALAPRPGRTDPGLAIVWLAGQRVVNLDPHADPLEPLLRYDPSLEGQAVLAFLEGTRDAARARLANLRSGMQRLARIFGWSVQVPELWIRKPWHPPRAVAKEFQWGDFDAIRDVALSADGRSLACVARRGDGRDLLLHMGVEGDHLRTLYRTSGMLYDLHWAPYKNRMMVVEQRGSALAPFAAHRLLVVNGLPEAPVLDVVVPFTPWVHSPQFSPDGQRLAFAAPDRFWRPTIHPADTYGLFEIALESEIGVLGPPPAPSAGGHE